MSSGCAVIYSLLYSYIFSNHYFPNFTSKPILPDMHRKSYDEMQHKVTFLEFDIIKICLVYYINCQQSGKFFEVLVIHPSINYTAYRLRFVGKLEPVPSDFRKEAGKCSYYYALCVIIRGTGCLGMTRLLNRHLLKCDYLHFFWLALTLL